MKIIITGHTGLLGSNLVTKLKCLGHEVLGMSRSKGINLSDYVRVDEIIMAFKPDVVYHLAANASEATGQHSPIDMTERNIGIFVKVLTSAVNNGVKRFIYASSVAVYGEAEVPYLEDGPTIPKDVYGVNKLASEQILKIMAKVYGFEYTIFRPHNIYGPGQNMSDPTKNVVALIMRNLIEEKPYFLFGEGKMRRAFSYVDDVVDVFAQALSKEFANVTMNVGAENHISIKELSDMIQEITGIKGNVVEKPARPQEISMFLANHATQRSLIEYKETPIVAGLMNTWDWVKKNKLLPLKVTTKEICLP